MPNPTIKKPVTQKQTNMQPWTLPVADWGWYTDWPELTTLVDNFGPIGLDEMDSVALLDRRDIKFLMPLRQLFDVLATVQENYWILSVQDQRFNHYRTMYFDTSEFELYHRHVQGCLDRYKVRSREYIDSGLSFLEVKHKTNKGRTIKERLNTSQFLDNLNPSVESWLQGVYPFEIQKLHPVIWNTFNRLTLINKRSCERVTLDLDLTFYDEDKAIPMDGITIAEVKLPSSDQASPFLEVMRSKRIHSQGFSKFCIGIALLYEQVKKNLLKAKFLRLEKIIQGDESYE